MAFVVFLHSMCICILYTFQAITFTFIPRREKDITGQKVLITGAGKGLGRHLALKFAAKKPVLILWDIVESTNEETAQLCRELGVEVHAYTCDVSNKDQVYATAHKVKEDVGDVDILVNNAGVITAFLFEDCQSDKIEKTFLVNVLAQFWTLKAFLRSMITRNHGHIVSISSMSGIVGTPGLVDYSSSKAALIGLDEALRHELQIINKTGVHTTLVCPGYIKNTMLEKERPITRGKDLQGSIEPDEAADRIVSAVLVNQQKLIFPRIMYLIIVLKRILPLKVFACLMAALCKPADPNISVDDLKLTKKKKVPTATLR